LGAGSSALLDFLWGQRARSNLVGLPRLLRRAAGTDEHRYFKAPPHRICRRARIPGGTHDNNDDNQRCEQDE
jgi:hypothetical protein